MTLLPEAVACGDPLRKLFFDRIGRYFENEGLIARTSGHCDICGAQLEDAIRDTTKKTPVCRPQRSIGQNRQRPADGAPVAFGAPLKPGSIKNSLNGLGGITLITETMTFVAANVIPVLPLPPEMTAVPVEPGVQGRFLRDFVRNPPKPPFLLIFWNRKNTMPLAMTEHLSRTMICGEDTPRSVDLREVVSAVNLIERIGAETFRSACWLRTRLGHEADPQKLIKLNEELQSLRRDRGMTAAEFKTLPAPDSDVQNMALKAYGDDEVQQDDAAKEAEAA
jgi:hypothetical protein